MANPNIEAAYFLVQVGQNSTNEKFRVKGSDFLDVAKGPEMVLVQRGDDHYWTWFGQPKDLNSPDYSYRFNYYVTPEVNRNSSNPDETKKTQPDGDGLINLSLYFESPGPYQVVEWRNVRNIQRNFKDLDGKDFTIYNNPDLKDGDVCRITHEGGDFEAWYIVDGSLDQSDDNWLKFKILYARGEDGSGKDPDRPRTDVKRTGTKPDADGTEVLKFDFYSKENAQPYSKIADTDWVWAQAKDSNNDWKHYKVSGKNFKDLFRTEQPNFFVRSGTAYFNMTMHNTGTQYQIEREEDGRTWTISGNYTNTTLTAGSYFIPMEGCKRFQLRDSRDAVFEFGTNFDTSTVTNMFNAFQDCRNFNAPVNHFDMSNCQTTQAMFYNCQKFNQSLAEWDLSSVNQSRYMFYNCRGFNNNVTNLKFGPTNCYECFRNCVSFNQPLTGVDFSQVYDVTRMFYDCQAFNQPIGHLDFSSVTEGISYTWYNCQSFNQDITEVTWPANPTFAYTWYNCVNLYQEKHNEAFPFPADTDAVYYPFSGVIETPSIANWTAPMPRVTAGLFANWQKFNQKVSHLDLSQCESFTYAFLNCPAFNASDIGNLNVSGVKHLTGLFQNCRNMKRDLSNWDVSECVSITSIFRYTSFREYGISNWDVSNVERFDYAFDQSIVSSDLSSWDVSKGQNFSTMFSNWGTGQESLLNVDNKGNNKLDCKISNWDMRSATNIKNMFLNATVNTYVADINTNAWRMPNVKWNGVNSTSDKNQPWYQWNKSLASSSSGFLKGAPGIGMPVIEPGYEPTYTVLVGTSIDSQIIATRVEKVATGDGQGVKVIEPNSNDYTEFRLYYPSMSLYQVDFFERSSEGSLKFQQAPYNSDFENRNWTFMEPFGPHPELMNSPTNMSHLFAAGRNTKTQITNVSGLQFINTSNVTNMDRSYYGQTRNDSGVNNDISGWDVSNVTCMDHMFACTSQPKFGDLRSWCVKHITSEPNGFDYPGTNGIITRKPRWGECPSDPGYVMPLDDGEMPEGPWDDRNQWRGAVRARLNKNLTLGSAILFKGFTTSIWWRTQGTNDEWTEVPNTGSFDIDPGYDYVIGVKNSQFGKWQVYEGVDLPAADLARVSNFAYAFENSGAFNSQGMEHWPMNRNASNIYKMFSNCHAFNQDLSSWNFKGVSCKYNYDYRTNNWDRTHKPQF